MRRRGGRAARRARHGPEASVSTSVCVNGTDGCTHIALGERAGGCGIHKLDNDTARVTRKGRLDLDGRERGNGRRESRACKGRDKVREGVHCL